MESSFHKYYLNHSLGRCLITLVQKPLLAIREAKLEYWDVLKFLSELMRVLEKH